jgi:hypothetical protein
MRKPNLGEASLGALAGAVVASIGGLFAVDVPAAIIGRNAALLLSTPTLSVLCWLVNLPLGWLIGGQIGPRMGQYYRSQRAEVIGGVLGGLVPVILIMLWGWHLVTSH